MTDEPIADLVFNTSIAAFVGAFFSYLFVRFAEVIKAIYDRQLSGFNALVGVERWLGATYDDIVADIFAIDNALAAKASSETIINFNRLTPLRFDWALLDKLSNLDFINELSQFGSDIRKLELTIEDLNSMYGEVRSSFLSKSTDAATYRTNFLIYLDKLTELRKFLSEAEDATKRLTALTRILLRDKPLFPRIVRRLSRRKMPTENEIGAELAKLNHEMEEMRKENAAKIQRIRK